MKSILKVTITTTFLIFNFQFSIVYAQISINDDGSTPDASAMLDISSTDKGILVPRMTTMERITIDSPTAGLLVYDTDANSFWYYENDTWNEISSTSNLLTTDNLLTGTSNPDLSCMAEVGSLTIGTELEKVYTSGDYAYILDDTGILYIVDVSDPTNPILMSSYTGNGSYSFIIDIIVFGDYAYLTDFNNDSFEVLNISDPTNPTLVGSLSISVPREVALFDNYAITTSVPDDTLYIVDVSDPTNLSVTGTVGINISDATIVVEGDYVYVLSGDDLTIINISDLANPTIEGSVATGNTSVDFAIYGNYAFVNSYSNFSVRIFDISDPTNPFFETSIGTSVFPSIEIVGTYALVTSFHDDQIEIIDISDPTTPSIINNISTGDGPMGCSIANGYAYVVNYNDYSLKIYKLSCDAILGFDPVNGGLVEYPNPNTDDQTIDEFSLSGNDLQLSLEDDGQSTQTVDLSSFLDNTDDQTIDVFSLSSNNLKLSLEDDGQSTQTVDLSSFLDNTDDQTIDDFSLSGNDLQLSLEDDGQSTQTVDLSSFLDNTDNQAFDVFTLQNDSLQVSLENDGYSTYGVDLSIISPLSLADTDDDTKIQVEESSDEDIIRFDIAGTEYFKMAAGRLEFLNTGSSVFIGEDAGENDDLTNGNVFVGKNAGNANTTGIYSTAIGTHALQKSTSSFNVSLGFASARNQTTGERNVSIGFGALENNEEGNYNVAIGYYAGLGDSLHNKSQNVLIGYQAGYDIETNSNTMLGYQTGYKTISGEKNVFLGYQAGYNETGSNKLYIENSNADSSSALIYGEFDNNLLQINGTLGINGTLNINNAFDLPTQDGTSEQILTTDGNGTLSWIDLNITALGDTDNDTKIQVEESSNEDIIRFDLGGTEFMRLDNGKIEILNTGRSTFLGYEAGENDDFSNNNNVFVGYQSGYSNTTGLNNTFTGYQSGLNNTTGEENTFIGRRAGYSNTIGSYNTFLGRNAGYYNTSGDDNTFTGYQSGLNNTTGEKNTFLGSRAGYTNTTGSDNVFVGRNTGYYNDSGLENVFLGRNAGYENQSGSYNVALGRSAGYKNLTGNYNVFLGYQAGYYETGNNTLYIENSNASSPLIYGEFDNDRLVINGNDGNNSNNRTLFVNGSIGATSAFNNDSDRRLKTNIQTIPNALNKVLEMRGVTYQWKDGRENGDRMGFIAQEVEPILPQVVDNQNDHYTMQYAPITAVLVEAVKEQQQIIENQQTKIQSLEAQLEKVNKLEATLQQLQAQLENQNQ